MDRDGQSKVSLRLLSAPGRDAQHHSNVLVFV